MKLEVSCESVYNFLITAQSYISRQDALAREAAKKKGEEGWELVTAAQTKFLYALNRVMDRARKLWQDYEQKLEDFRIENCTTEKNKDGSEIITRDSNGHYQFSREGLNIFNKKQRELAESKVEIEAYFATSIPKNLTFAEQIAFENFVLKEIEEPSEE